VDRHLIGEVREFSREPLDTFDEERGVLQTSSLGPPGAI